MVVVVAVVVVAEVEVEVFVVAVAAAVAATAGFLADGQVKGERAQGDSHRRCSLPVVRSPFFRDIPSLECIYITVITLVFSPAYTTHTTHRIITSCSPRFRRGKHVGQKKSRLIIMSFLLPPALYCNDHDTEGEGAYIYICMDTGSIRPT